MWHPNMCQSDNLSLRANNGQTPMASARGIEASSPIKHKLLKPPTSPTLGGTFSKPHNDP